jgi:hypothetical protein
MKTLGTLTAIVACLLALALAGRVALPRAAGQEDGKDRAGSLSTEDWLRKHQQWLEKLENEKKALIKEDEALREKLKSAIGLIEREAGARKTLADELQGALASLALNNPPVGSVVAYAGPWPPREAAGAGLTKEKWEEEVGWALCDNAIFSEAKYPTLARILGEAKLPDYRGLFLRGLDPAGTMDPDRAASDRFVGNYQLDAVGPHKHPVVVSGGKHSHGYKDWKITEFGKPCNENDSKNQAGQGMKQFTENDARATDDSLVLSMSGTADNSNLGQGSDTRPRNRAVHYLIKTK